MKTIARIAIICAGVGALSSCHIYKKFEMPTDESGITAEYVEARKTPADSAAFGNLDWRKVFTDPALQQLIEAALVNNTDLQNAKLNVDIAQSALKGARLSYLPSLTLAPNASKAYFDVTGMRHLDWTYQIPLTASWEVDIFGKLLNANRRAKAALLQTQAYEQAVRSQIIGGVANCYYAIAMLERQLQISRETSVLWGDYIGVMKNLKLAGRVTEAAVVQTQANYYSILGSITDLETALHEANNTMSLLLNVTPQEWSVASDAVLTLPAIYRDNIPMRELAARPDVLAAEQGVATAYYATNQARAAFYPGLTISATGGVTNSLGSLVHNPAVWFANLAGSLTAPLFARGQLISGLEQAKAAQQQAMNTFEHTLLNASAEVSDALVNYTNSSQKAEYLVEQVDNLAKAVEYTQDLLALNGNTTYLEVLTAQQALLQAQLSQAATVNAQARAAINLYQSLGGGR